MIEKILAIAGRPGLYRLVSRGNRNLIVETLDADHKRVPAFASDRVIALTDIAMYTEDEEVPLRKVLLTIRERQNGALLPAEMKKASKEELFAFLTEVLPNADVERIYPSDIKKLIAWYNILVENGVTDFEEPEKSEETEETAEPAEPAEEA
ncbi:MAG: DUF5606 domain-containing protein [Bacteroidaceae bacterium]|nr:DUF5606 domain-containing protein [Bacteroidaceae bacterium]